MKRHAFIAVAACLLLAGCSGVTLSSTYSNLLDQTAALSAQTATAAQAGTLTAPQMAQALQQQAQVWQEFRDARDGVTSTTQP